MEPRHVRIEALHEAEQAVDRVLARHGIHRDLVDRYEPLDLALDEAAHSAEEQAHSTKAGSYLSRARTRRRPTARDLLIQLDRDIFFERTRKSGARSQNLALADEAYEIAF